MSESTNTIRLMKAAKEFNIGKNTIVDFLTKAGFSVDNKPDPVLSNDMYDALIAEYDAEKAAKKKSENVVLSKSNAEEHKQKVEKKEEVVSLKKEEAIKVKEVGKIDLEQPKPVAKKAKEVKVEEVVVEVTPPVLPEPVEVVEIVEEKPKKSKKETVTETIKIEAPELEGPKIMGKIDMEKPAKGKKKTTVEVPKVEEEKPVAKAEEVPVAVVTTPDLPPVVEKEDEVVLHTIKRETLSGPKVIGRIELPKETPKDNKPKEQKKKRKRIPLDNKGQSGTGTGTSSTNTNTTQGQGTGTGTGQRPNFTPRTGEQRGNFRRDNTRPGTGGAYKRPDDKPIDQNEIQDKIKETLAKLGTTTRGKSLKAKYRRNKREEMAEKRAIKEGEDVDSKLQLTEFISVSELANLMDVNFTDVISKCMSLGIMVSINQRLDAEVIELVASEFGFEVEFINLEQEAEQEAEIIDAPEDMEPRAPIVTIMGHVDHGKTSLLDYIRRANVVAGEAGGITQHIGAYEVTLENGKEITFLDTPGHEAFTAMRARGAKVTDIAVIVVSADDSVMPQTKEAISHAQAAGVPMIFAINKIDKDGANPDRIREQLSAMNILVEEWGGKYQSQDISAKSGLNVDLLLEKILLEAEILDLKANPNRFANGSVVEASLDKGRGFVSTILVQSGTLKIGDMIVAGSIFGRVKAMTDERGKKKTKAGPSTPVQILGLNGAPQSGEKFKVYDDEVEAKEIANHRAQILREQGMRTKKHITLDEIGRRLALGNFKQLNVIIKGDVDGSVEALSDSLQRLSTAEIAVSVVHKAVGQITESDVLLATASDAIILGFQVRPSSQAAKLAENENIEIRYYSIIYDAIDEIRSAMEGLLEPKIEKKAVCNIEVREVFKITGVGTIAGCYVMDGKIKRDTKINLVREGIVIYTGELASLKRYKDDVKEVLSGTECGLGIKNYNDLKEGDIIEGYEEIEVKRTL
ncbi:MAG: translation initiation factor IF-2 [Bacteroidetes bacterium]|nr:translation initiation factor IF-2 [Bacteroidota bacterium]